MLSRVSRTVRSSHQTQGAWRSASSLSAAKQKWNGRLVLAPEVEHALEQGAPVIALESTIITHGKSSPSPLAFALRRVTRAQVSASADETGMPHPTNLTTAQSLESIIRSHRVTPATIALIDGKVHVGLSSAQLEQLADPTYTGPGRVKASRRDLAGTLSKKLIGGTTVASTMYVAQSVGVDVFVTGGIGGAHRGSQDSMDISADLIELGRTPMAVVCAGAKSILDIPRTLEVLETQGVCVASYGDSHDFPAFYSPSSGQKSPWNVANPTEAASLIHAGLTLPHPLATLLAVPIPAEYAARGEQVQQAVEQAVRESIEQGIDKRGKEVTPWLLKRVGELTRGTALELNVRLIENNARVGSAVALELARLKREAVGTSQSGSGSNASNAAYSYSQPTPSPLVSDHTSTSSQHAHSLPPTPTPLDLPPPKVLVFGSAAIDITSRTPHALAPRSTTPGEIDLTPGGVGRNIAEAAQRGLGKGEVRLISPVGASLLVSGQDEVRGIVSGGGQGDRKGIEVDTVGRVIMAEMAGVGMRTDGLIVKPQSQPDGDVDYKGQQIRSSACTLVLGKDGDLEAGVADMGIVERVTVEEVQAAIKAGQEHARMIVHDCNPTPEGIRAILQGAYEVGIPSFCDPTSTPKLQRLIPALRSLLPSDPSLPRPLTHISPNTLELDVLHDLLSSSSSDNSSSLAESNAESTWAYINSLNLTADFRARVDAFVRSGRGTLDWLSQEGVIQKATSLLPWFSNIWIKSGFRGVVRVAVLPSATAGSSSSGFSSTATLPSASHTAVSTFTSTSAGSTSGKRLVYPLDPSGTGAGPHAGKSLIIAHYPAPIIREEEIVSTTGAGDSLVGGLVAGLVKGLEEAEMVGEALDRVGKSLRSRRAVA